jgi:hypothetical protein
MPEEGAMKHVARLSVVLVAAAPCALPLLNPANAQTLDQRFRKLESGDTNRQDTTVLRRSRIYSRATAATAAQSCGEEAGVTVRFLGGNDSPATSHAWLTASVRYANSPSTVFVNWAPESWGFPCGTSATLGSSVSGTVELRQFCTFPLQPDNDYVLRFNVGIGNPCLKIISIDAKLKLVNEEMIEPPD